MGVKRAALFFSCSLLSFDWGLCSSINDSGVTGVEARGAVAADREMIDRFHRMAYEGTRRQAVFTNVDDMIWNESDAKERPRKSKHQFDVFTMMRTGHEWRDTHTFFYSHHVGQNERSKVHSAWRHTRTHVNLDFTLSRSRRLSLGIALRQLSSYAVFVLLVRYVPSYVWSKNNRLDCLDSWTIA